MKTGIIAMVFALLLFKANAQETGIQFEKTLSWSQLQEKAKAEHKYLFVDCYATWCGPCKWMDANVYNQKEAGELFDKSFVSVRVQMDRTKADNAQTKSWYAAADQLAKDHEVYGYPTLLFFDPDGQLISKVTGAVDAKSFMELAAAVQNKGTSSLTAATFKPNTLDTAVERSLAKLYDGTDKELAGKIAADYLNRIPQEQLKKASNGQLMWAFQDNADVANIAIKAIENGDPKDNLEFIESLRKQPAVQQWAANYLAARSNEELSQPTNLTLMIDFQDDPKVLAATISFIESDIKGNLDIIEAIAKQPAVITWARKYVQTHQLSDKTTQQLAAVFKHDPVIKQYANQYINKLSEKDLYTHDNIELTKAFADTLAGRAFELFYKHGTKVDTVMHDPNYARGVLNTVVAHQLIKPATEAAKKNNTDPDWTVVAEKINRQFGKQYEIDNLPYAQQHWYLDKKDGVNYAKYIWQRLDNVYREKGSVAGSRLSPVDWWNPAIWPIFQYDQDKAELEKALGWMQEVNQLLKNANAMCLDTQANLLYKLGRKDDAIAMETQATRLDPGLGDTLKKMQAGEPTWPLTGVM